MSLRHFRPGPGLDLYGTQLVPISTAQIGGANFQGGASPLTANATTTFRLGPLGFSAEFVRVTASTVTVPVDADGTILARAMKYSAAADAQVQMSADLNLEALVTREGLVAGVLPTASDAAKTIGPNDSIEINVVSNSAAIDTQPAGLVFTVWVAVIG